jgi:hypothetical protein
MNQLNLFPTAPLGLLPPWRRRRRPWAEALHGILHGQYPQPQNPRAYAQAVSELMAWCEDHRAPSSITAIKELTRSRSAPTAKQRLSAIRAFGGRVPQPVGRLVSCSCVRSNNRNQNVTGRGPAYLSDLARDSQRKRILSAKVVFGSVCKSRTLQHDLAELRLRNERHALKFDIGKSDAAYAMMAALDLH